MSRKGTRALVLHGSDYDAHDDASLDAQPGPRGSQQHLAASASLDATAAAKQEKPANRAAKKEKLTQR